MTVEFGGRVGQTVLREAVAVTRRVTGGVAAAGHAFAADVVKLTAPAVTQTTPAWIKPIVEHCWLQDSAGLVAHLPKLAEVTGPEAIVALATASNRHRSLFTRDVVALAERSGYADLASLQRDVQASHLKLAGCQFCNLADFHPKGTIIAETANYAVGPNHVPLYRGDEQGGHLLVFPKHHRSVMGATPESLRREFVDLVERARRAMEQAYGKPVSIIANGLPGRHYDRISPFDSHAHVQMFSGDLDISAIAARRLGWTEEQIEQRVIPLSGWDDYFRLYEQGRLRERYVASFDASGKGHLVLIGNQKTPNGFARVVIAEGLGIKNFSNDPDHQAANRVTTALRGKL